MGRADHWPSNNAARSEDTNNREKTVPHHAQKQTTRTGIHGQKSGIPRVTAPQSSHRLIDTTPEAEGHVLMLVTNFPLRVAYSQSLAQTRETCSLQSQYCSRTSHAPNSTASVLALRTHQASTATSPQHRRETCSSLTNRRRGEAKNTEHILTEIHILNVMGN